MITANRGLNIPLKINCRVSSVEKNQAIRDAKVFLQSIESSWVNSRLKPEDQRKYKVPDLKKPATTWNNQNYFGRHYPLVLCNYRG
jgi:hypothetical protein